jgi:hypothetical protein
MRLVFFYILYILGMHWRRVVLIGDEYEVSMISKAGIRSVRTIVVLIGDEYEVSMISKAGIRSVHTIAYCEAHRWPEIHEWHCIRYSTVVLSLRCTLQSASAQLLDSCLLDLVATGGVCRRKLC